MLSLFSSDLAIDLGTSNPTIGLSNLTLSVTQPLLQGGGWAVTLEALTQAAAWLLHVGSG